MPEKWECDPRAPFGFGQHPDYEASYRSWFEKIRLNPEVLFNDYFSVSSFFDRRHPEIFLIPRNVCFLMMNGAEDIFLETKRFPFSSYDFYVDTDKEKSLFWEFCHSEFFSRIWGINQLAFLVPPQPKGAKPETSISYIPPSFHHTRWEHSLITAVLAEVILGRNGFSQKGRNQIVLTAGSHDIATPAGGDSVKRIDPQGLDEEKNYSWFMEKSSLFKRWKDLFGFRLDKAQQWVEGKGLFGRFLDVIDKISYTALDCYAVGFQSNNKIRQFGIKYPLVMDIWQEIFFSPDKSQFAFSNPENLFHFLLFRAYEFQEFLL